MESRDLIESFDRMWGSFPEPAMLVHKNRTVLAVNQRCSDMGVEPQIKCFSVSPAEVSSGHCRGCKANEALRTGRAISRRDVINGEEILAYWVPVTGVRDLYVHFSIGTAERVGTCCEQAALSQDAQQ